MRTMVVNAEVLQAQLEHKNELAARPSRSRKIRASHKSRSLPAQDLHRRAASALERAHGRYVAGRPAPADRAGRAKIEDSAQLRRFSVLPGITCIWQMSGRNNTDFDNWIRQDLQYIDNWSLLLDLKILIGTVPAVLWGKGAM
jgi:hypothetical protein